MQPTLVVNFSLFELQVCKVDTSKRIDDLYYKSEQGGYVPVAYCFKVEHKEAILGILAEMRQARENFISNQYKTQMFLRSHYGV